MVITPIGSASTRLVILRGSSGSGKSTVAAAVRAARPAGTVAVLGQDIIRREILGTGNDLTGHAVGFLDISARYLLDRGIDVIIEGILNADWYAESLRALVADHHGVSRCYIYDLPFEVTVHRHATRPIASAFGADEMRKWWRGCQPVADLGERVITAQDSLEDTVTRVLDDCWSPDPVGPGAGPGLC